MVVLWAWVGMAVAGPAVEVLAEKGAVPAVRVRATGASVVVDACRGVVWEGLDEAKQAFVPLPAPACGPTAPAVEVDGAGLVFRWEGTDAAPEIVRAVVVVGAGCAAGRPLAIAGCKAITVVEGPPVAVPKRR
jgi:hypothetical protein